MSLLLGTSAKDLEKVIYFAPSRKTEKGYKVTESSRPDIVAVDSIVYESELKIHSHYQGEGFAYEEAFQLEGIENVPANVGDIISVQQVARYKTDYGDDSIKVEPAFILSEDSEELDLEAGAIVPLSQADENATRAKVGNSEAFIVTAAVKLPYVKGKYFHAANSLTSKSYIPENSG